MTPRARDLLLLVGAFALALVLTGRPDRLLYLLLSAPLTRPTSPALARDAGLLTIFLGLALPLGAPSS